MIRTSICSKVKSYFNAKHSIYQAFLGLEYCRFVVHGLQ
jgi:hypothetical protein